jgi:hypothetical protein
MNITLEVLLELETKPVATWSASETALVLQLVKALPYKQLGTLLLVWKEHAMREAFLTAALPVCIKYQKGENILAEFFV